MVKYGETFNFFKYITMGPMILKEMKHNLHYGKVRGDVLLPSHGTNTSCSVMSKKIAFGNKEHTTDYKMGVTVLLRLFISSNEVCNTTYAL